MNEDKTSRHALLAVIAAVYTAYTFVGYMTDSRYFTSHFSDTGQIGDTVGGLTAPIIGILNAVLLFLTLRKQDAHFAMQEARLIKQENDIKDQELRRSQEVFNEEMFKRITIIRELISEAGIDIDFQTDSKEFEYKSGLYKGEEAFTILSALFSAGASVIDNIRIPSFQFNMFMSKIVYIKFEAAIALDKNINSVLSQDDKDLHFIHIKNLIQSIHYLRNFIEEFVNKNPNHSAIEKYSLMKVVMAETLKESAIEKLDPSV